ncbi:MAG: OmpH family outer membrane protein [Chlamydiales bacterium]|nr:OmpH family outer membrane protein [Chlamydiales bacterium]
MKKHTLISLVVPFLLLSSAASAQNSAVKPSSSSEVALHVGVVNFKACVEQSKLGKAEQAAFESLKDQMSTILEKTEKELEDIANKLNDPEHLDSLSTEAEADLKTKFQSLSQELGRYQNQYYQILNQANFKLIHELGEKVSAVSESVAKEKGINLVLNEDACFYYAPALDITKDVVVELDKRFDAEEKTAAKAPDASAAAANKVPAKP